MKRRELMELLGDESPSYERIRFVCQTPGSDGRPWLQLPRTFRLDDPSTYFTTDIKVRHTQHADSVQLGHGIQLPERPWLP